MNPPILERRCTASSAAQTQALAKALALAIKQSGLHVLVGLCGELGAGKTTFVQGFVKALAPGRDLYVSSPTFAIVQRYDCEPPVTHMDLYRLGSLEELEAIGYRELYFGSEPGITLVEWIDQVPDAIPDEWIDIRLVVEPTDVRDIHVRAHGEAMVELINSIGSINAHHFSGKV